MFIVPPSPNQSNLAITRAWYDSAIPLAEWTAQHLVNRTDVWGQYLALGARSGRSPSYTAPSNNELRFQGALTPETIRRHFRGADYGHLIGLHSISPTNSSRWFVIDIDRHDGDNADPQTNFRAAVGWWSSLREMGFSAILLDSNGAGGFHLVILFAEPMPSTTVFNFGRWQVRDYTAHGLAAAPETFPKQDCINAQRPFGSFWRLPGRHHTRDHWTRVWCGSQWLEGSDAIEALLSHHGDPGSLIPKEATVFAQNQRAVAASTGPSFDGNCRWSSLLQGREVGSRHNALLQLAGHYLGHGIGASETLAICMLWNLSNRPPLAESELRDTVHDLAARHRPANQPRTITLRIK